MRRARFIRSLFAGGFGQIVAAAIQFISLPLFLNYWGVDKYGEWLILSAIPAYLAMSDLGFTTVASNEMTMQVAAGNRDQALRTLQSTFAIVLLAIALMSLVAAALALLIANSALFSFKQISPTEAAAVICIYAMHIALMLFGGLITAGLRSEGKFALGMLNYDLSRLLEFLAVAGCLVGGLGPIAVATAVVVTRIISTSIFFLAMRRASNWVRFSLENADLEEAKRLLRPSIAFMAFPFGNALLLQGMTISIGATLGSVAVVLFTTLRTVTRTALQALSLLSNAIWPEISTAYGSGDLTLARKLHQRSSQYALWLAITIVVTLFLSGDWLISIWTHGKVHVDKLLFLLLLIQMLLYAVWFMSSIVLAATNRHQKMAAVYLASTITTIAFCSLLLPIFGIYGAGMALAITDLAMIVFALMNSCQMLEERVVDFLRAIAQPPSLRDLRR